MTALAVGATLAWARLRTHKAAFLVLGALFCTLLVAWIERASDLAYAADHALTGGVFGLVVPLLAYLVVERATLGARLDRAVDELARHGADRRALALGLLSAAAVSLVVLCVVLAMICVFLTRGIKDPFLLSDLVSTSWIAALSGVAYAAWFAVASLGGKRGWRGLALLFDFILGSGASALAAPFPRGHVRNLLGGEPVLGLAQPTSAIALITLIVAYLAVSASRTAP